MDEVYCKDTGERFTDYRAYLKGRHWQNVRSRYWSSKMRKTCFVCNTSKGLELHHRTYKRIGNEKLHDLVPLCRDHHQAVHDLNNSGLLKKGTFWKAHRILRSKTTHKLSKEIRAMGFKLKNYNHHMVIKDKNITVSYYKRTSRFDVQKGGKFTGYGRSNLIAKLAQLKSPPNE